MSLRVVLLSGNIGCLLSNENWARFKVMYKRLVISYTLPLSTIGIIARRTFLLFSVRTYLFFFPPTPGSPTRRLSTYFTLLYVFYFNFFTRGEKFNPTFPEKILIFACNISFNLKKTRHICGHLSQTVRF